MEDSWFGSAFQVFEAADENDLEAAMVVLRGGTHIETADPESQPGGATDSKSSIALIESCLYPISIRYMDVNDTGERGPEHSVKSLQLWVV